MTKQTTLFITILTFFSLTLFAQEGNADTKFKRVTIPKSGADFLQRLAETGVDLHCGAIIEENSVQLELSEYELQDIAAAGFTFNVLIDDLTKYYSERAQRELPTAMRNLELEKQFARFQKTTSFQNIDATLAKKPERLITRALDSVILGNIAQADTLFQEIDWVVPQNYKLGTMGGMMTVSELENELDLMRSLFPNLITVKAPLTTERTWQNRPVWYVKISDNPDTDENEPETLMTSLIHAREVASININLMFMWYLLENYATDSFVKNIVDNSEMYFIPMVNPDGVDRNRIINSNGGGMQRKNLRNVCAGTTSSTQGVDLNRNFDYWYAFPNGGSSTNTCSDSYRGPNAFSEPESRMLRDFVLAHQFKTVQMHHSFANSIPHPYGGNPTAVSGREAEYHKFHEDMTQYNRYIFGATVFPPATGIADDWMLGGAPDNNGRTGSGQAILGTTPESGARDNSEGGFWPNPAIIPNIAKRGMRINFINVLYSMKLAVLHDLTPVNLSSPNPSLQFGIERLGQTPGNFTLTITPVSSNIVSITQPAVQTGMAVLEQRKLSVSMQLRSGIQPYEKVEFIAKLSNENHDLYETKITKIFLPQVLFTETAESGNLNNWTTSGSWVNTNVDSFNGTRSLSDGNSSGAYGNNQSKALTLNNTFNLTTTPGDTIAKAVVNFYTRWDLERNFDFVEFQGSVNGTTWTPLLGRYNKPATQFVSNDHANKISADEQFQPSTGSLLYDGDRMDKWVLEQVVIDSLHNSFLMNKNNVRFRFVFRSDGSNVGENYPTRFDGFYIDDFTVSRIQPSPPPETLSQDDLALKNNLRIFPNPFKSNIQISWPELSGEGFTATIYDLQGRLIKQQAFTNGPVQTLSLDTSLSQGLYLLQLESNDGRKHTEKLVKN